jgi:hypothetical protein
MTGDIGGMAGAVESCDCVTGATRRIIQNSLRDLLAGYGAVGVGLAMWFDRQGAISEASRNFGPVLRLIGLERFSETANCPVEAALSGQSVLAPPAFQPAQPGDVQASRDPDITWKSQQPHPGSIGVKALGR